MIPGAFARLATVILLVGGGAGIALAHATLRRAEPPVGGRVPRPPGQLKLEFSEAVVPRTSRVDLIAPDSQRFALQVTGDSTMANVLLAQVPTLRSAGQYRVEWRLIGPDGHAVTGKYGFTVDSMPAPIDTSRIRPADQSQPPESSSGALVQGVIRFAASLVLVTVIGSVAFALFVLPVALRGDAGTTSKFRSAVEPRLHSLCVAGSWLVLALGVVRLLTHGVTLSGSTSALQIADLGDLILRSTFGKGWLLQMSAAIGMLLVLRAPGPTRWRVLAVLAVALAFSAPLLGHPAGVADAQIFAVGFDGVHVLGAGGWAGAILVMSIAALPQVVRVDAEHRLTLARNLLAAFTPLALMCASVLLITGAASAWLQLRDLRLLLDSGYGLALVRKVVIVLLIAALGAYHWRVARPSMGTERAISGLRTSIAFDAALVLVVLVLTAILTGTAPPPR